MLQAGPVIFGMALFVLIVSTSSSSSATTFACRPGVKEVVYKRADYVIGQNQSAALHRQLQDWGKVSGFSVSGVGFKDPYSSPVLETEKTILQSSRFGVVLSVKTSNRNDRARVTIENNCWAPQEDWRPYWQRLKSQLSAWGYLKV